MLNLLAKDVGAGLVLPKRSEPVLVVVHGLFCQKRPCDPLGWTLGAMANSVLCCVWKLVIWKPTLQKATSPPQIRHPHPVHPGEAFQWRTGLGDAGTLKQEAFVHSGKLLCYPKSWHFLEHLASPTKVKGYMALRDGCYLFKD